MEDESSCHGSVNYSATEIFFVFAFVFFSYQLSCELSCKGLFSMKLHRKLVRLSDVLPHLTSLALPPENGKYESKTQGAVGFPSNRKDIFQVR